MDKIEINIVKDLFRGTFTPDTRSRHLWVSFITSRVNPRAILSLHLCCYIARPPPLAPRPRHDAGSAAAAPCFLGLMTKRMIRAAMMSSSKKMILRLVVFFW